MFNRFILWLQLQRYVRAVARTKELAEVLDLKTRFPEHGTYNVGGIKIVRFDASNGLDIARLARLKPADQYPDLYTLMIDPKKVPENVARQFAKPKVEKVRVDA